MFCADCLNFFNRLDYFTHQDILIKVAATFANYSSRRYSADYSFVAVNTASLPSFKFFLIPYFVQLFLSSAQLLHMHMFCHLNTDVIFFILSHCCFSFSVQHTITLIFVLYSAYLVFSKVGKNMPKAILRKKPSLTLKIFIVNSCQWFQVLPVITIEGIVTSSVNAVVLMRMDLWLV